jgi:hypothetical protein
MKRTTVDIHPPEASKFELYFADIFSFLAYELFSSLYKL